MMNRERIETCGIHGSDAAHPAARLRAAPHSVCSCTTRFGLVMLIQLCVLGSSGHAEEPHTAPVEPVPVETLDTGTPSARPEDEAVPLPTDPSEHDHESHRSDHIHHDDYEELVVTAAPLGRTRFSVLQGTNVLQGEELARKRNSSLGETLALEPGIHSDFFSPAASRPIIRGQGGVRVDLLNDGLRALDASSESPDHATTAESLTAQRIEVIRGPATLLYGSAAAGGVVNVLTGRIASDVPEEGTRVEATADYGSNGNLREGGGVAEHAVGDFVVHVDGFGRAQDDYAIPGYAESDRLIAAEGETRDGPPEKKVENSDLSARGAGGGVSWLHEWGHVGVSAGWYASDYGVPGHEHDEVPPPPVAEPPTRIELDRWRIDLEAVGDVEAAAFDEARFRFGYSSYEHQELEGSDVATVFTNEGFDLRLELGQAEWGVLDGAVGLQATHSEFGAVGDEAFVPPAKTENFGLFTLEEISLDRWVDGLGVDAGLRYEYQHVRAEANPDRIFHGISISAGVGWQFHPEVLVGVTGFRNERLPQSVELYSNGPHLATQSYDVGDATLDKEVGKGVELAVRRQGGRLSGGISVFYTAYDRFVYRSNTGQLDPVDGELPVYAYIARDAEFFGGELDAHLTVWEWRDVSVGLDVVVDAVRARLRDDSEDLPRIPPLRVLGGIELSSPYADLHLDTQWARKQDQVAPYELPTDAYVLVNLSLEVRPFGENDALSIFMNARNLADQEARSHSSALKDLAPLPGRDFRVGMNVRF